MSEATALPPTPTPLPACHSCHLHRGLVRHCSAGVGLPDSSPTCDLVKCRACDSFGTPDGTRWFDARKLNQKDI